MGIVVLLALANRTVVNTDDVENKLGCRSLGTIPFVKFDRKDKKLPVTILSHIRQNGFREAVGAFRNAVMKRCEEKGYKTIVVTSTVKGEGKSTIAVNLALALARHKKQVVILDCDMRNPSVAPLLKIDPEAVHIASVGEVLNGDALADDAMYHMPDMPLWVLPANRLEGSFSELASSPQMESLISLLRERLDYVVIDTPPAGTISDAIAIAQFSDVLLYVVRQDKVPYAKILDTFESFRDSGVELLGSVLNMTGARYVVGYGRYGYGYGYTYGYGYGQGRYGAYGRYGYGYSNSKYGYGQYGYGKDGVYGSGETADDDKNFHIED
jgi:capsular exopolysaccharide synthesis family protein